MWPRQTLSAEGRSEGTSPGEGGERARMGEAPPVANLGGQRQRTKLADAPVGVQASHGVGERRLGGCLGQAGALAVTWSSRPAATTG